MGRREGVKALGVKEEMKAEIGISEGWRSGGGVEDFTMEGCDRESS